MRSGKRSVVTESWIANASPLILLGKADMVELLIRLPDVVLVPESVLDEISVGPDGDRIIEILRREGKIRSLPSVAVPTTLMAWDLGAGETQVIAAAASLAACRVVLDDLQARRCARAMGLRIVGTLGLVARAKRLGMIAGARPYFERLRQVGLYATDDLVEQVVREVGE
jgi:predicted nucleic acid-binding protein